MKFKRFLYFAIIIILVSASYITVTACSRADKAALQSTLAADKSQSSDPEISQSQQSVPSSAEKAATTTRQSLPENLQKFIDDADKLFASGEYAEAVSAYRTAKANLQAASIDLDVIKDAVQKMEVNFEKAKSITDTARIHYGNAMQLEYEKRIDEAIKQLEEALEIYAKYQDAIDALASIKTLYNLK